VIRRKSDSRIPQSEKLSSQASIANSTERKSSRLGQYKLREDDLIKPTNRVRAYRGLQALMLSKSAKAAYSEYVWGLLLTNSSRARICEEKREQRSENCEIGYEVSRETPILAGMAETAAGDVESANFCGNGGERENHDRRSQN
jgi:hypothetical protein